MLLGFWIVNCLIVPRASADLARRIHPTPSALAFSQGIDKEIKQGINSHDPTNRGLQDLKARVFKQYGVDREEDLPVSFAGIAHPRGRGVRLSRFRRAFREALGHVRSARPHSSDGRALLTVPSCAIIIDGDGGNRRLAAP